MYKILNLVNLENPEILFYTASPPSRQTLQLGRYSSQVCLRMRFEFMKPVDVFVYPARSLAVAGGPKPPAPTYIYSGGEKV